MGNKDYRIKSRQDLEAKIEELGILPFFKNSIEGFSIEEHIEPELWFEGEPGPWEWKGPVIRNTGCAYGKFFENKAAFVSRKLFPDFANYRRDGYDFDARFDDELASYKDKALFDLIDANAPVKTGQLKKLGNYGKDGNKGFETVITRLQAECYVIVSDFEYSVDKYGNEYGWGVSRYSTPEKFMGKAFTSKVYQRTPEKSYERILSHLKKILPDTDEKALVRFLTKGASVPSRLSAVRDWLVPSNPKYFDIVGAFRDEDEIFWKQGNDNIHVGDTAWMYVGVPYSAILYECRVTETDIPFEGEDEHVNIKKLMKIRKVREFAPELLRLAELAKFGVVTVRCTRSMPKELLAYVRGLG